MTLLPLDPDQLLTTTRAVRRRLDFTRPVPRELIRECVEVALQAPSGSNLVTVGFVVVVDLAKRRAIGQIYREVYEQYRSSTLYVGRQEKPTEALQAQQARVATSADYLGEHMGDAPALVLVVTSIRDRATAAESVGNVYPAAWSFMLAARARGLGTAWTAMHRAREREIAELLDIPYDTVAQAVLTPLAYTLGDKFSPALRPKPDEVMHWDGWSSPEMGRTRS